MKTATHWNNLLWAMIDAPDVDAGLEDTKNLIKDIQIDSLKYAGYVVDKPELDKIKDGEDQSIFPNKQLIEEIEEITRSINRNNAALEQMKTDRTILRKKYYG